MTRSSVPTHAMNTDFPPIMPDPITRPNQPIVIPYYNPPIDNGKAERIADEIVNRLRRELSNGKEPEMAKNNNDRYDWALDRWQYALELAGGIKVFRNERHLRLAKYLLRSEEIREQSIGHHLVDQLTLQHRLALITDIPPEKAPTRAQIVEAISEGVIVDVIFPNNTRDGYWVVTKNDEIDIFRGKGTLRPVTLTL